MLVVGNTVSGGGLTGKGVPVPTTARPLPQRTRRTGLDWGESKPDPDAIARGVRQGWLTVTEEVVEDKRVVRRTGRRIPPPDGWKGGAPRKDIDAEAIVADYIAGASIRDLVRKYGVANQTVRTRLKDANVTMRPPHQVSNVPTERIVELYEQGLNQGQIGEAVGLKPTTISYRLRTVGIFIGRSAARFDVEKASQMYAEGMSTPEIAQALGVGRKAIANHLTAAGVTLRTGGGARWRVDPTATREDE